jgi:hypothetical protein
MVIPKDLPISLGFQPGTTHLIVGNHFNTKCILRALFSNCHIVTVGYLEAIVRAAKRSNGQSRFYLRSSPLEIDFYSAWPNPSAFLSHNLLRPDSRRHHLFEGWTFLFADEHDEDFPVFAEIIQQAGGIPGFLSAQDRPEVDLVAFGQKYRTVQNVCLIQDLSWNTVLTYKINMA